LRHLGQVLLVRIERLHELLGLFVRPGVVGGQVEALELHLVFRPYSSLGKEPVGSTGSLENIDQWNCGIPR